MCGIVGYVGPKEAKDVVVEGLKKLEYRGYDSSGIAYFQDHSIEVIKTKGKIIELEKKLVGQRTCGKLAIGHTRWATHGRPTDVNAHPHRTPRVALVHNGIIENHAELKQELIKKGYEFVSETDTEVLAVLIHSKLDEGLTPMQAVQKSLAAVEGAFALAIIIKGAEDQLFIAKNLNPLIIGLGKDEMLVASDISAIIRHTNRFIILEDNEMGVVSNSGCTITDFSGKKITKEVKETSWNPTLAEKEGYKHFMKKEIFEQPRALADTLSDIVDNERFRINLRDFPLAKEEIQNISRIVIVACGTSYHAGLVGKFFIENLCGLHTEVDLASEFRYRNPIIDKHTVMLLISQSGETIDTIGALMEARARGAKIVSICNVRESTIDRKSDYTIFTDAGPEIGVASTKAFTAQLMCLAAIALFLRQEINGKDHHMTTKYVEELLKIPGAINQILGNDSAIQEIAREFFNYRDFLYLGRGNNFPIALEGALKLKEISYIHAEGYAAGEMKHGPIALIDEEMPVVVIAPRDRYYQKTLSNLEEVKSREGIIISLGTERDEKLMSLSKAYMSVPPIDELFYPLLTVVPLQLLAYYIADFRGTDIDQPRNLAKSVTVE